MFKARPTENLNEEEKPMKERVKNIFKKLVPLILVDVKNA